ncbi:MAG: bifunctional diaminohydroxyphosphoribosylaminopyrimidine deaminase/5-amino-6-(5-phosphoribosylamino)uracil reductase RibD [Pedobacter sp.]
MQDTIEHFMNQALELARQGEGRTRPNPAVGAVIVKDGVVIGRGFHPKAGQPHAEIFALREAGNLARQADMYVTLEPCSHYGRTGPCADAIIDAGIARVYVGTTDPNPQVAGNGIRRLREAGIQVFCGILENLCLRIIAPFAKHIRTGLPYVVLKSAMTLDGKTATACGHSQWVSNSSSRLEVHRLRNRVDGIMVGIGTVLRDNPQLTTRLPEGGRDPERIVVDSNLRIPEESAILQLNSSAATIIATTGQAPLDKIERLRAMGAEVLVLPAISGRVELHALLAALGKRGLQNILLEGGAELNGAFWRAGLVDRLMMFVAPKVVGGEGKGVFAGPGVNSMTEATVLQDVRVRQFGEDTLIEGEVKTCSPV